MNFLHSMEQRLLKDTIGEALAGASPDRALAILADLEVFGLLVPEHRGGSGLGLIEAAIVVEGAAKAGVRLPLSGTILLVDAVAQAHPDAAASLLRGEVLMDVATSGSLSVEAGRIHGSLGARNLDSLHWLAAPVSPTELALLEADQLTVSSRQAIELNEKAVLVAIDADHASTPMLTLPGHAEALGVLQCAELLGAASHTFDLSVAYLKDRQQFGQPIGTNQALKHMAADAYMTLENVRVAVEYAAAALDAVSAAPGDAALTDQAARAVKVMLGYVPSATRQVAETAVQFHGGIGLTWEYELNGYLRHIIRLGMGLGHGAIHRRALLETMLPTIGGKFALAPEPAQERRAVS